MRRRIPSDRLGVVGEHCASADLAIAAQWTRARYELRSMESGTFVLCCCGQRGEHRCWRIGLAVGHGARPRSRCSTLRGLQCAITTSADPCQGDEIESGVSLRDRHYRITRPDTAASRCGALGRSQLLERWCGAGGPRTSSGVITRPSISTDSPYWRRRQYRTGTPSARARSGSKRRPRGR